MKTHFDDIIRLNIQRLAELKKATAELERELSDTGMSLDREFAQPASPVGVECDLFEEICQCGEHDIGRLHDAGKTSVSAAHTTEYGNDGAESDGPAQSRQDRTSALISHGRRSVYHRGLSSRGRKAAAVAAFVTLIITILITIMSGGGASWPPSVATVQSQISTACENPDVMSEPGQVNFACGKTTRQILWVFSLLTSSDNPNFASSKTGRRGLEPITPAQGGEVAASLNLHHPYNPSDPVDSLEVAARAINDIIGGATLTGVHGNTVVQGGLESDPANCVRYTGSPAVISRKGFPSLCAKSVSSPAGQAALVADVYKKWVVGASATDAQDAAVLFANAKNPGDPRVQRILKYLPHSRLQA